jgi:hypothetical protein
VFTTDDLRQLREAVGAPATHPLVGFQPLVLAIANAYLQALPDHEQAIRSGVLCAYGTDLGRAWTEEDAREELCFAIDLETRMPRPAAVGAIQPPACPPTIASAAPVRLTPPPAGRSARDPGWEEARRHVNEMRTAQSTRNGEHMVDVGREMVGWFRWRRTDRIALGDRAGSASGGAAADNNNNNNAGPDFASWLRNPHGPPDRDMRLNCWEAILVVALRAGLTSPGRLHQIHAYADQEPSDSAYYECLGKHLRLHDRATLDLTRAEAPKPRAGDLLFFREMEHVALCLGVADDPSGGAPCFQALSLWTHGGGRLSIVPVETLMRDASATKSSGFRPCPFPI